jgi:hypothetical protein
MTGGNYMNDFINQLSAINNHEVLIHTTHKWFDEQKIRCKFHLINDSMKIGFKAKSREIFLWKTEVTALEKNERTYYIKSDLRTIAITPIMNAA